MFAHLMPLSFRRVLSWFLPHGWYWRIYPLMAVRRGGRYPATLMAPGEGGWFLTEGRNSEVTCFVWDDGYGGYSIATSELILPRQQFQGELAATVLVSVDCRGHSPIASPPRSLSQLIAVEHGQGATCFVAWPHHGLEPVTSLSSPQLG